MLKCYFPKNSHFQRNQCYAVSHSMAKTALFSVLITLSYYTRTQVPNIRKNAVVANFKRKCVKLNYNIAIFKFEGFCLKAEICLFLQYLLCKRKPFFPENCCFECFDHFVLLYMDKVPNIRLEVSFACFIASQ